MPVCWENDPGQAAAGDSCIRIGLVNNMPDGALEATERQFMGLLGSAAPGVQVRLSRYALPGVPRTEQGRLHIGRFYFGIESLWNSRLDGLIVSGAEPQAPDLIDEPYWGSLAKVIDWAQCNTHSTIWSCLAAHAAVQHLDGIGRRRLAEKCFGVFECTPTSKHHLTSGLPPSVCMPHSRWNDLPEDRLRDRGYRILTRLGNGSVDTFVKQRQSLFVFFQGHPEYESNTLALEYRRDVGRYLRRERDTHPAMPQGFFDGGAEDTLKALRGRASSERDRALLADFPPALMENKTANTWHKAAAHLYANWLEYLLERNRSDIKKRRDIGDMSESRLAGSPAENGRWPAALGPCQRKQQELNVAAAGELTKITARCG